MAKTIDFNEASKEMAKYLKEEISAADLMEQTAMAQVQLIIILNFLDRYPGYERPLFDELSKFFDCILPVVKMLKNFER